MKKVIVVILSICSILISHTVKSQTKMNTYDADWKTVDDLVKKKGLPQSALAEVEKIYNKAKKENNQPQLIKALVYQLQLGVLPKENGTAATIAKLESEILAANSPAKQVLQSIIANIYWQYFQQNRFSIYGRTNTNDANAKEITTLTIDELHEKIGHYFRASLENETLLKTIRLENFEPVLSSKGNTRNLRPTLYDLLTNNALDYFESDEQDISKPAYAFTIEENAAFDPIADFIHHQFHTKDSGSLQYQALLIYQKLLAFHAEDKNPEALVDADLRRLQFVYGKAVMPEKDSVYRMSLQHIHSLYENLPVATRAAYLLAQYYYNQYSTTQNDKTIPRNNYLIQAKTYCDQAISRFPTSEGAVYAANLLNNILQKSLQLQTEKVNVPGQAFRALLDYRNIGQVYLRIVPLDEDLKNALQNRYQDDYWTKLVSKKATRQWQQTLPIVNDYEQHSVEIKIDALPTGDYVLLSSINANFNTSGNLLAANYFYVSDISYVNNGKNYFVLHRQTGQPLANAAVQVWTSRYDYTDRKNQPRKVESVKADQNGFFRVKEFTKEDRNIRLDIKWQKDRLFMADYDYLYTRYDGSGTAVSKEAFEKGHSALYLFTDRAIYRPGQIVYFKGIAVTKSFESRKAVIITKKSVKILFRDANDQVVDSVQLITSDYGSVHGSFQIPQQVLTGNFEIISEDFNNSNTSITVEEYKRPKFFVEINAPKQSFRLNDTVTITGSASAYAGNAIDGATVQYRVFREVRYLYPWLFYRRYIPRSNKMEITNGIATTDVDGKFNIQFPAIPDITSDKTLKPVFNYTVQVDVTDINGETRSGSANVPVGYQSLVLTIENSNAPQPVTAFNKIKLSSKNLSDEWQEVEATVNIYPLEAPNRLIRKRYWDAPDQFIYDEAAYIKLFPNDEYNNETDPQSWKKQKSVFSQMLLNKADTTINTSTVTWKQGWYLVEATAKDKDGGEVKAISYIQLYDPAAKGLPAPAYTWATENNTRWEPGQTASLLMGTAANDVYLVQVVDKNIEDILPSKTKDSATTSYSFFTLNNEKKNLQYPLTEADRGGFGVTQFFVKHNRLYSTSQVVQVPWTNKELSVKLTSFRDKTEPGSTEKWQVNITGAKGDKVAAEMLTTMYDASLDQFLPHQWSLPAVWPAYYATNSWRGEMNFVITSSFDHNSLPVKHTAFDKKYDQLLTISIDSYRRVGALFAAPMVMRSKSLKEENANKETMAEGLTLQKADAAPAPNQEPPKQAAPVTNTAAVVRKNFNETAFFFPDLKTDDEGNISLNFTLPEALTRWKLMTLAHTTDLALGDKQAFTVTQKQLMVQPNAPRFVREKDSLAFSAKIVNMSEQLLNGFCKLELLDAATMQPVDYLFGNAIPVKNFSVVAGQSVPVHFQLNIPGAYHSGLLYRISATVQTNDGKTLSDGEENILPVLTNQMLLTESLPLNMRADGLKKFKFEKLLKSGNSASISNYGLTVEYTANPAWYAIQALPYLADYPYECAEQTFNRYYANILAATIANSSPRIKTIIEKWQQQSTDSSGLVSALQKNEELKAVMLQETPWLIQAKNQTEQQKNIALLFDMVRMSNAAQTGFKKIKEMQTPNGGFTWFKGGSDDRYITQYILAGIGHLQKLGALQPDAAKNWNAVITAALTYTDQRLKEEYDELVKEKRDLKQNNLNPVVIQYLYMRSFFTTQKIATSSQVAYNYYLQQAQQYWLQQSRYMQGLIALAIYRSGNPSAAAKIMASLKEQALYHDELGMYWKDNRWGYYWYQSPIEVQALLIEAFSEVTKDTKAVNDMKTWLLKQKQTQHWGNTKATAEACYALLLQGNNWLANTPEVVVQLGDTRFNSEKADEAGTGYFKYRIEGEKVNPAMGNIQLSVKQAGKQSSGSWGAVYWQYFEDLDKVTPPEGGPMPLQLKKQLYVERATDKGPLLEAITAQSILKVGDKIKVRIELRVDRAMQYVHMKDGRPAGSEPLNVLSTYKWQDGLGYYEATKDASTNFFFSYLNKGTYVFEYPLFISHTGNFSAGVATIQCMYAPEFVSHSEGVRITVAP